MCNNILIGGKRPDFLITDPVEDVDPSLHGHALEGIIMIWKLLILMRGVMDGMIYQNLDTAVVEVLRFTWKTVSMAKPMLSKEVMPSLGPSHFSKQMDTVRSQV